MRARCKSIDASDQYLDHLLTGQVLWLEQLMPRPLKSTRS